MRVVFLGNIGSRIVDMIKSLGDEVIVTSQVVNVGYLNEHKPDFIVSYGYPHIVSPEVIEYMAGNIINLHISYLPWNRGSDPDFWSLVDNTPKGVTIHYMDESLDTGDIIFQSKVVVDDSDSLASYYHKLNDVIILLFKANWSAIRSGNCNRQAQRKDGSYHRSVDKEKYAHLLKKGSNTLASEISKFKD